MSWVKKAYQKHFVRTEVSHTNCRLWSPNTICGRKVGRGIKILKIIKKCYIYILYIYSLYSFPERNVTIVYHMSTHTNKKICRHILSSKGMRSDSSIRTTSTWAWNILLCQDESAPRMMEMCKKSPQSVPAGQIQDNLNSNIIEIVSNGNHWLK